MPRAKADGRSTRIPWLLMAQASSYLLLGLVVLFWTTLVQTIVFPRDVGDLPLWLQSDLARLACIVVPITTYMLVAGNSLDLLNQSSLHLFYRSRLARTYVATGNDKTGAARFPIDVLLSRDTVFKSHAATDSVRKATELVPGDDVDYLAYAPHSHGGPIHLIGCCINQSTDDRTGTFNADRKGVP